MLVSRLTAVLILAASFGAVMSRIVYLETDQFRTAGIDYIVTGPTSSTLCDSDGRRPCP